MPWTFYNSAGQKLSSAATSINVLDIDGATALSGAVADADLFIVDDNASGANRKVTAAVIKTYVGAVPTEATQDDMEDAGTTNPNRYVSPEVFKHSDFAIKATVNVTAAGAIENGSVGITRIDDDGTGDKGVVFSTPFGHVDSLFMSGTSDQIGTSWYMERTNAGEVSVITGDNASTPNASDRFMSLIFAGDQ